MPVERDPQGRRNDFKSDGEYKFQSISGTELRLVTENNQFAFVEEEKTNDSDHESGSESKSVQSMVSAPGS